MRNKMLVDRVEHNINKDEKWQERLMMHSFVKVADEYYFASLNYNGLYKYSLVDNKLFFLGIIPGENISAKNLYSKIVYNDGVLYMAPMNAKEIAIYDIRNSVFIKVPLHNEEYRDIPQKFFGAVAYKNKIYLIPARYNSVVVLEDGGSVVRYLEGWNDKLGIPNPGGELWVKNGYFVYNDCLYLAIMITNIVIKIDLSSDDVTLKTINGINDGFVDAIKDDEKDIVWLVCAHSTTVVRWDMLNDSSMIVNIGEDCGIIGKYPFINILQDDKKIYVIAYQAMSSVCIDKSSLLPFGIDFEGVCEDTDLSTWGAKHYFGAEISLKCFVISNVNDGSFSIIKNGRLSEKRYLCNKYRKMQLLLNEKCQLVLEDRENSISAFLQSI